MTPNEPVYPHPAAEEPTVNSTSEADLAPGLAAAFGPVSESRETTSEVKAGTLLAGRYRLVEAIGEGGMGSVWLASQSEPVKRKVAIKLIKAGMDSRQVLMRFEAERQALAMMDHPNIAKVLDGGLHEGRPFFVMELVKGVPITEYCDMRKLTPPQRLELFVPVCQAIQHAHQKGIIHRDIKPSNVLVALYDDRPVPKVIDFGVAKAMGGALTQGTLETGFGAVVGTPAYMSPEQATLNNLDIDTRSDVYSLGVLLYELLTGSPPFSKKELEKRGLLEILRVVREEEPPRPSTKLSTAEALPSIAANRGVDPKSLTGLLRNELDWIVMKALEKDRSRRYETANGFAADVMRYLSGEPVQAHPPSTWYRTSKWAAKYRMALLASVAVVTALALGLVGTTWGMWRARVEASARQKAQVEAEANLDLANQAVEEYLLRLSEDDRLRQQDLLHLRRQLATLARGFFERLLERKRDEPGQRLTVARALYSLGKVEFANGEYAKALQYFNEAKEYLDSLPAEARKDSTVLTIAIRLSHMRIHTLNARNDREASRTVVVEAESLATAGTGSRLAVLEKEVARVWIAIANFHHDGSDYERSERYAERAVLGLRESLEKFPDIEFRYLLVRACVHRASAQQQRLRFEQALASIAEGLQASREVARENPLYFDNLYFRAQLLKTKGLIADAQKQEATTLALAQERLGILRDLVADYPSIPDYRGTLLDALQELGETLSDQGKHEEGLAYLVEGVTAGEKYLQRYPEVTSVLEGLAVCVYSQARTLLRLKRTEEALRTRIKSIELQSKLAERYPDVPRYQATLSRYRIGLMFTYLQLNRQEEALAEGQRAVDLLETHLRRYPEASEAQRDLGNAYMNMAGLHSHRGEFAEAEKKARRGIQVLSPPASSPRPESWKALVAQIYAILARAQLVQKKWDLAEQSVQEGLRLADKAPAVKAELEKMNKFLQARKTKDKPGDGK